MPTEYWKHQLDISAQFKSDLLASCILCSASHSDHTYSVIVERKAKKSSEVDEQLMPPRDCQYAKQHRSVCDELLNQSSSPSLSSSIQQHLPDRASAAAENREPNSSTQPDIAESCCDRQPRIQQLELEIRSINQSVTPRQPPVLNPLSDLERNAVYDVIGSAVSRFFATVSRLFYMYRSLCDHWYL